MQKLVSLKLPNLSIKGSQLTGKEAIDKDHLPMRNYMRDIILGTNDGLVSIFALVLGVAGGGFGPNDIFLTGLAGTIAGAISMAFGEYLSTKSQEQVYDAEMHLERLHIKHDFEREKQEIHDIYQSKGFKGQILTDIVETITGNEELMLQEMMINEFGVLEHERRSPMFAALFSGVSFMFGSLPAFLPFLFVSTSTRGIIWAGILSGLALFFVGSLKGYITRFNILKLGFENFILGVAAGGITYSIGYWVGGSF